MALFRILSDVTGSRFLKMSAAKPEVLISQLLDKIATPFSLQQIHVFSGSSSSKKLPPLRKDRLQITPPNVVEQANEMKC